METVNNSVSKAEQQIEALARQDQTQQIRELAQQNGEQSIKDLMAAVRTVDKTPHNTPAVSVNPQKTGLAAIMLNRNDILEQMLRQNQIKEDDLGILAEASIRMGKSRSLQTVIQRMKEPGQCLNKLHEAPWAKHSEICQAAWQGIAGKSNQKTQVATQIRQSSVKTGNIAALHWIQRTQPATPEELNEALLNGIEQKQPQVAIKLVEQGANPFTNNLAGLRLAFQSGQPHLGMAIASKSQWPGQQAILDGQKLAQNQNPKWSQRILDLTLIETASRANMAGPQQRAQMQWLIEAGANPHAENDRGFEAAAESGSPVAVATLLNHAQPKSWEHSRDLFELVKYTLPMESQEWLTEQMLKYMDQTLQQKLETEQDRAFAR